MRKLRDERGLGKTEIPGRGSDVSFLNCLTGILAALFCPGWLQL